MNVAVTDRCAQSVAQQVSGEYPFDLHTVTGENGAYGIRIGGAVSKTHRKRHCIGVRYDKSQVNRCLDIDVRLHGAPYLNWCPPATQPGLAHNQPPTDNGCGLEWSMCQASFPARDSIPLIASVRDLRSRRVLLMGAQTCPVCPQKRQVSGNV